MTEEGSSSGDSELRNDEDEPGVVEGELTEEPNARPGPEVIAGEVIETPSVSARRLTPTPEDLARYEEIHPGFTDRMLTLTEQETAHRIAREDKQDDATISVAKRGQIFAFIVVMALVLGGIAAILTGHSIVGFAGLILAAGTLAGAFIAPGIFSRSLETPAPPGSEIEQRTPPKRDGEDSAT